MNILLNVEPFNNPIANNRLLDTFLAIKKQIIICLEPVKEKVEQSNSSIVVHLTPSLMNLSFITNNEAFAAELNEILNQHLDLATIATGLLGNNN